MQQYCQITDGIGGSGGRTLMVGDQHNGSLSGPPYKCAMPPVRTSGGSNGDMPAVCVILY